MTYTADTPILGRGTVSAEAIDAWFAAIGPDYARAYAPDRTYRPAPESLGRDIVAVCGAWGINHDVMAAQIAHESAAWQSAIARDKRNPSGLGAVNDNAYAGAATFATPTEGIRATAAHLMAYAKGAGPWRGDDPRYDAVALAGWLGVARTWGDLNGRWAYPGTTYGQQVTALANRLVSFANDGGWEPPMNGDVPIRLMLLPADASNTPRAALVPRWITIHETANPTVGADAVMHGRWLLNLAASGASEPSWHYTVDDHQIVQHLPEDRAGWHAGDGVNGTGNRQSIGIELCVNSDGDTQLTRANAAWLVRGLMARHGIPVERVVQHNHWSGKDCPTQLRRDGWAAFVASLSAPPDPPKPPAVVTVPDPWKSPFGQFWIPKAFVADIDEGRWMDVGYALGGAVMEGELLVQYFERARLELQRNSTVTRGRVAAELLEARHEIERLKAALQAAEERAE